MLALLWLPSEIALGQDETDARLRLVLQKASSHLANGKYDKALILLAELDREYPDDLSVLLLTSKVYIYSRDYEKAASTIEKMEKLSGRTVDVLLQYGHLYLRMGKLSDAAKQFDRCLKDSPRSLSMISRISDIYRANGLYDEAVETYLKGRERHGDMSLFAEQLGRLYEIRRDYPAAAREYYMFTVSDTLNEERGHRLLRRLIDSVDDDEDIALLKAEFVALSKAHPSDTIPRKYYADLLIRQGNLREAYKVYKEVDELRREEGRYLVFFARRCLEREDYPLAAETCRFVLDQYPGRPSVIQARYVLSAAYSGIGHGDSAIAVLHQIAGSSPDGREVIEARFAIGRLYLESMNEPDSALAYFSNVPDDPRTSVWYHLALLWMGDCYIALDDFEKADSLYNLVQIDKLSEDGQEGLIWRKAQSKFFSHSYDEAKRLYAQLTVRFRKGLYVNDCLRKILMIDENVGFDRVDLDSYADSEHMIITARYDSAVALLTGVSLKEGALLADISTFRLGELQLLLGDSLVAVETFQRILDDFEESFYRAESLRYIADIQFESGDLAVSESAYRRLLTEFDNLILQEHARKRLKEMETL
jgi:tetratricopeptide (TPR) repeat protein